MDGKVALEEHYSTVLNNRTWDSAGEAARNGKAYTEDVTRRLLDHDLCLADMDRSGIAHSIRSLTAPGVQSVVDPKQAVALARDANDTLEKLVRRHPDRFSGFAAVALQDSRAAADELERAVRELGFKGAMINSYSNIGSNEEVLYLDEPPAREFWERVSALEVPVYLHPREPLPSQLLSYRGYPELGGSAWGFGQEVATHAVRLLLSGLFDEYPNLQIILGHMGEGLTMLLPRLQHRLDRQREGERGAKAKKRISDYFSNNFWVTTSGQQHANGLSNAINQMGSDRIMFSADYPYEEMASAARWFDDLTLADEAKYQIGRGNAERLFSLDLGRSPTRSVRGFGS